MRLHWKLLVAALVVCLALLPLTARAGDAQTTKITIALVGAAHVHVPGFIAAVKARNDVRVKYVWDHDAALAKQCAAQLDAKVVSSPEQIWSDPEVAAVAIYSETDRHYDLVLAAAKAGKHMFVEKPLGADSRQAAEMAAAIERAGLLFNMGYIIAARPPICSSRNRLPWATWARSPASASRSATPPPLTTGSRAPRSGWPI